MRARVTAILVARNGADYLKRTLAGVDAQRRRPDAFVVVDAASSDESAALLAAAGPTQFVTAPARSSLGGAVAAALRVIEQPESDDDWLWLLAHDNAPEPGALGALLDAVEIAPSVAVAGPKLMQWDEPEVIESFGESMTVYGRSVQLVTGELDQAQHDRRSDLLAVAAGGMLVRRRVWSALGGFDPGLPTTDAALDFCVRVRLAGHRVVTVPAARVATDGGPEHFGRATVSAATRSRSRRAAQLRRRLVYAPGAAVPLHWLALVPLGVVRALVQLAAKRAWAAPGEIAAAFATAFDPSITGARRNLARGRSLGWGAIAPLRVQSGQARELAANRAAAAVAVSAPSTPDLPRPGFFTAGGAWIVIALATIGVAANLRLLGEIGVSGGGIVPLSASVGDLWGNVGFGWRDIDGGFAGASDPFSLVLAVLGTLTFWSPSSSIVVLYVLALPLAGLAAWACAARFATRGWAPAIAAVLWALAPPFLAGLNSGHLGAVVAHILLPWLVLALVNAARSLSAAGAAALLFAAVAASAPVLVPVLVIGWVAWLATHPRAGVRLAGVPVPALVLFAPLVLQQGAAGNWLGLLADPGVASAVSPSSGWQLALGAVEPGLNGWTAVASALGLPGIAAAVLVAALLAPAAALALLSLFLPGSGRAIPAMSVALLGFLTAVLAAHVAVSQLGSAATVVWPGSGLSVYWLGVVGAVVIALEALGRAVVVPALLAAVTSVALAVPLLAAPLAGTSLVTESSGRLLPAFVTAEAAGAPSVGTLELVAQPDGSMRAALHRGVGTTLDEQSTLAATSTTLTPTQERIAELAGNLSAPSGYDIGAALDELHIGFVVLATVPEGPAAATAVRAADALDSSDQLVAIGETANGYLWQFPELQQDSRDHPQVATLRALNIAALAVVFGIALLLAIPTGTRRRPVAASSNDENPADTFEEDENA